MKELTNYHYTESGLDYIWLANGVFERETPYGKGTTISELDDLHSLIGRNIVSRKQMTGPEIRFLRTELDLSQRALSDILGTTEQTFARWETGKTAIPGPAQNLLSVIYIESLDGSIELMNCLERLSELDAEIHEFRLELERAKDGWASAA